MGRGESGMTYRIQVYALVLGFFKGNRPKADYWMTARNPLLGYISPEFMLKAGRGERLLQFVEHQLSENVGP